MDKFWANLPGTGRQSTLWSPIWLKAEIGTSFLNDIKAQFLCRSRDVGALKTSLAETKYLEKFDDWKSYLGFEGPDFGYVNQ